MNLTIDPSLELKVAAASFTDVRVGPGEPALLEALEACAETLRRERADSLADAEAVRAVRALFRSIGVDPTRYRPSSEALARRALKGSLPSLNNVVDVNNLCSLEALLPIGAYDTDRLDGDVHVRLGAAGESYEGFAKTLDVAGRLVACDKRGPFGSPIADSRRTAIAETATSVTFLVYAPASIVDEALEQTLTRLDALTGQFAGGRLLARRIYSP